MLRKMRFTAPPEQLSALKAAAAEAHITLADYFVDEPAEAATYGWPMAGDGSAAIVAIVDDSQETGVELQAALRAAHTQLTGDPGDWIRFAKSYVYFPDGLENDWYDTYAPLAATLHAAEDAGDVEAISVLRGQLDLAVTSGCEESNEVLADFADQLVMAGVINADSVHSPLLTVDDILNAPGA